MLGYGTDSQNIAYPNIKCNRIKCLKCGDILESYSVYDFKMCSCGAVGVDGGHEYIRRIGEPDDWEELTEYEE